MGRRQFAVIRSSNATRWLGWISRGLSREVRYWPYSATKFREVTKEAASTLGLSGWNINGSSMRAGGSTHFHIEGTEVSRLKFWGRWASERSLAHYLQESMATLLLLECPSEASRHIACALRDGVNFLEVPEVPWWHFFSRPKMKNVDFSQQAEGSKVVLGSAWRHLYPQLTPAGHETQYGH